MLHSLFVHVRVADLHTQVVLRGFDWNLILSVGTWDDQHRLMQAAAQKFLPHSALVRSFELQQNGGLLEVDPDHVKRPTPDPYNGDHVQNYACP